ncbi:MAG: excinuclease ABC subunit UvrC [Bacteroidota bacterium]|nr:excinuclease ABC subunit UvrC [Bacteroidota bacterium]
MGPDDFKMLLPSIPPSPGVYRFMDDKNGILYVGKAKNLKNRLHNYFGESKYISSKTRALIKHAITIEFTLVDTEHDALLLENSLIKKHQPRYNVMLKDGKTYVYICIKKEDFPRVYFTRRLIRDGSIYFGPYTSKYRAEIILDLIKTLFPLRTCYLNLAPFAIQKNKYKVCLEYHIKNCLGPCEQFESKDQYDARIDQVKNILKGHFKLVKEHIQKEMRSLSQNMEFEKAQQWKIKLDAFEDYQSKSTVVSNSIKDLDVFSIAVDEEFAYINFIKVIDGAIIHTFTIEATKNAEEETKAILEQAVHKIRNQFESIAPEIIIPFDIELEDTEVVKTIPQRGDKKHLLELSEKNVQYMLLQKKKEQWEKTIKPTPAERILHTLKQDLSMDVLPSHIECFDNSNFQGTHPVSACVVFKNAKPSKKDYRHFNIKTVEGPNDFASMEEVVYRRYKRMLDEEQSLPQLIIIDGGKGQLSSANKSLETLQLDQKIKVIGIAKKLEEIYFPNDSIPLYISKKSESLKLIQQMRNEAHRFGINHHRLRRSKSMIQTELYQIPGIGAKTAQKLLSHFGSVQKIKEATPEEILSMSNKLVVKNIEEYFKAFTK